MHDLELLVPRLSANGACTDCCLTVRSALAMAEVSEGGYVVPELRTEREASSLDLRELIAFVDGGEAASERRREICESAAVWPGCAAGMAVAGCSSEDPSWLPALVACKAYKFHVHIVLRIIYTTLLSSPSTCT